MALVNIHFLNLQNNYLFADIAKKVNAFKVMHPKADVISLGIGDVTQPLAPAVIEAMPKAAHEMAFAGMVLNRVTTSSVKPSSRTISCHVAYTSISTRSSSTTVQRAIRATSRSCSIGTTSLVSPTPSTPSISTPT